MSGDEWARADSFGMATAQKRADGSTERLCILFNRGNEPSPFVLPDSGAGGWTCLLDSASGLAGEGRAALEGETRLAARSVTLLAAAPSAASRAARTDTFAEVGQALRSLLTSPSASASQE
jgi:hypothetical protein